MSYKQQYVLIAGISIWLQGSLSSKLCRFQSPPFLWAHLYSYDSA